MIEFLPYGTQVPLATKGSILRPSCYAEFADIIESVYTRYNSVGLNGKKVTLSISELEAYLKDAIAVIIGDKLAAKLTNSTDLFNFGVDSLQTARIRMLALRDLDLGGNEPSQNVVYKNPSINKLAAHLHGLRYQGSADASMRTRQQHAIMLELLEKYASRLETHSPSSSPTLPPPGRVVVLTGATGSLGAHLVHNLLPREDVSQVIALVQAKSNEDALQRVDSSLKQRMLPPLSKLRSDSTKLVALAADLDQDELGLSPDVYASVRDTVTDVIQNGWSVNFNLGVESFEADNICGAFNLLNLCLRSPHPRPASFFFSSSVSARQGVWEAEVEEVLTDSPRYAAPTGYGHSKWVVESLCGRAARDRGLYAGVLRIGQLTGDRGPSSPVYHVVNPNMSTHWSDIYHFLKDSGLKFEVIDRHEWFQKLEAGPTDLITNPSYKLLEYFRNRYGRVEDLHPSIHYSTTYTKEFAPSIALAPAIDRDLVSKWVSHWRNIGFFK